MDDENVELGEVTAMQPLAGANQVQRLFELAIDKGLDVQGLEKLVTLHERVADRAAAQEFAKALAAFQEECPPIRKTSTVQVTPRSGMKYSYNFAKLEEIVRVVRPLLVKHGLSFSWDSETGEKTIKSTCTLEHVNGHKRSASFSCVIDSPSPQMPQQHKTSGSNTFARRQALVQVLGLTTTEPDDDGHPVGDTITDSQVADIEALISEVGADRVRFLKYCKVEEPGQIRAADYAEAVRALEQKRRDR